MEDETAESAGLRSFENIKIEDTSNRTSLWPVCGKLMPRPEIVFISQMLVIYVVIVVSLFNLTSGDDKDGKLWIALLSSCLGYMLPNPKLERP